MRRKRIAIIGAGPIGLEAGLLARMRDFDVTILERGRVAENVQSWGHVRLFSPFELNASPWGREALAEQTLPEASDFLTGSDYFERYLRLLSQHPLLDCCVQESTEVLAISRDRFWKSDEIGRPTRLESPFRLLLRRDDATEDVSEADFVFDCSGTYGNHNWIGAGGIPAPGERNLDQISYELPDITGPERDRFAGRTILVVGSGYSAATAVVALTQLAQQDSSTRIVWTTRSDRTPPLTLVSDDPLPERSSLTTAANALATSDVSPVRWISSARVLKVTAESDGSLRVTVQSNGADVEELAVDRILGLVGYKPDRSIYEELQVHECYATQGPIRLAAALLGETSQDCLAQSESGVDTLKNPEPGFYILGSKSYGRDSRFLLKTGLAQVESVMELICDSSE